MHLPSIMVAIRAETNSTETQPKQTFVRGSFCSNGRTWRKAMKFRSASTEEERLSLVHLEPMIRTSSTGCDCELQASGQVC